MLNLALDSRKDDNKRKLNNNSRNAIIISKRNDSKKNYSNLIPENKKNNIQLPQFSTTLGEISPLASNETDISILNPKNHQPFATIPPVELLLKDNHIINQITLVDSEFISVINNNNNNLKQLTTTCADISNKSHSITSEEAYDSISNSKQNYETSFAAFPTEDLPFATIPPVVPVVELLLNKNQFINQITLVDSELINVNNSNNKNLKQLTTCEYILNKSQSITSEELLNSKTKQNYETALAAVATEVLQTSNYIFLTALYSSL